MITLGLGTTTMGLTQTNIKISCAQIIWLYFIRSIKHKNSYVTREDINCIMQLGRIEAITKNTAKINK